VTLSVSTSKTATLDSPSAGAAFETTRLDTATDRRTAAVAAIELMKKSPLFIRKYQFWFHFAIGIYLRFVPPPDLSQTPGASVERTISASRQLASA
jgi:hypothetical protein